MSSDQPLPIVDDNAKASQESVLAVTSMFSMRNGFIAREDKPDYGIDLEVELIINNNQASGKRFPIQIKSSASFKRIVNGGINCISRSFSTKTLHYLSQNTPTFGIIILYDDNDKCIYYEYVEDILMRLSAEKGDFNLRDSETTTIHIATENILTQEKMPLIYQRLLNRFNALSILIEKHGGDFAIPSFTQQISEEKTDDLDQLSPKELLEKYGMLLIDRQQFTVLHSLISKLSIQESLESKQLIFICCLVYGEMGKCIEAEFYLSKYEQIANEFSEYEKETLRFTRIKVDFLLGKRSVDEFFEDISSMVAVTVSPFNALQLRINLAHYNIQRDIENRSENPETEKMLTQITTDIAASDLEEEKQMFLTAFHSENLFNSTSANFLRWISDVRVKEGLGIPVDENRRNKRFFEDNQRMLNATQKAITVRDYALKHEHKLLQAYSEYALARFYFTKEFHMLVLRFRLLDDSKQKDFRRSFLMAVQSCNIFIEHGMLKDARLSLIWQVTLQNSEGYFMD